MSVLAIAARIECDSCGRRFFVNMDPAYSPPEGWSLWDCAVNEARGGIGGEDPLKSTSVQDGKTLCPECTRIEDARHPEPPEEGGAG